MAAGSNIVRGLGKPKSFCSCSHGAGRIMIRNEARRPLTVADQEPAAAHVECRRDQEVIDELPLAYKDIATAMQAQRSLVEVVRTLR